MSNNTQGSSFELTGSWIKTCNSRVIQPPSLEIQKNVKFSGLDTLSIYGSQLI
jgi:hypothetical protein